VQLTLLSADAGVMTPETALSRVNYDTMLLTFKTNTMGPILVCQHFSRLLSAAQKHGASLEAPAVIANMSARVGSISDNELGGWYSYRCFRQAVMRYGNLHFKIGVSVVDVVGLTGCMDHGEPTYRCPACAEPMRRILCLISCAAACRSCEACIMHHHHLWILTKRCLWISCMIVL
jgi:hypothetical protein